MINEVYAIYDEACEAYSQFMCCPNEKVARMNFEKLFKDKRLSVPMVYDYPETFKVYKIATFDDNAGLFENVSPAKLLLDFGSLVLTHTA